MAVEKRRLPLPPGCPAYLRLLIWCGLLIIAVPDEQASRTLAALLATSARRRLFASQLWLSHPHSACWEENGDDRPDFVEVQQILGKMRAELLDSSSGSALLFRDDAAGSVHSTAH